MKRKLEQGRKRSVFFLVLHLSKDFLGCFFVQGRRRHYRRIRATERERERERVLGFLEGIFLVGALKEVAWLCIDCER